MPSDRYFAAYIFMAMLIMLAALAAVCVWILSDAGLAGLLIVIPTLMLALPIAGYLLWDTAHTAWHNNILWNRYPQNNKR